MSATANHPASAGLSIMFVEILLRVLRDVVLLPRHIQRSPAMPCLAAFGRLYVVVAGCVAGFVTVADTSHPARQRAGARRASEPKSARHVLSARHHGWVRTVTGQTCRPAPAELRDRRADRRAGAVWPTTVPHLACNVVSVSNPGGRLAPRRRPAHGRGAPAVRREASTMAGTDLSAGCAAESPSDRPAARCREGAQNGCGSTAGAAGVGQAGHATPSRVVVLARGRVGAP